MKRTSFKRILAVMLAFVMVLTVMPVSVFGDSDPVPVAISADDLTVVYLGSGYYVRPENGPTFFYYEDYPENITVMLSDGTTFSGWGWQIENEFGLEFDYESDQSPQTPWGLGEHTCTLKLGDSITGSYKVTVVQSNIKSISASPITLTQNCIEDGYYNEAEGYFKYTFNPGEFTVTFKDDSVKTYADADDFWGEYNYYIDVTTDQSAQNPWGLGTHTATVSITGVSFPLTVNIVESPVQSVTTTNDTVIEGTGGYMEGYWDDNLQQYINDVYYRYMLNAYEKTYTVTYKNGTVITGDADDIYQQTGHYVEARDPQSRTNQFTVGTYTIPFSFYGCAGSYNFTVTPTPVASITATPISLEEGSDGYMAGYWDDNLNQWVENAYFRYEYDTDEIEVTVTYNDGTPTFTGTIEELQAETGYEVDVDDWQGFNRQFAVGNNDIPVTFMGVTCMFTVTVTPDPVASISVANVTRTMGESNVWCRDVDGNEYPDYAAPESITVTMTDGTVYNFTSAYSVYETLGKYLNYTPEIEYDYYNQWTPGVYNVTARVGTKECVYTVTLNASSIDTVTIVNDSLTYEQDTNGSTVNCYEDGQLVGQYFEYRFNPEIIVTFNDGTPTFTGTASAFASQYGYTVRYISGQSLDNQWVSGDTHEVALFVGGIYTYFYVTITSSNIDYIEVLDYMICESDCTSFKTGEDSLGNTVTIPYYEWPDTVTVYYTDGSYFTGSMDDIYAEFGVYPTITSDNTFDDPWDLGEHWATISLLGFSCTYCVEVAEPFVPQNSIVDITFDDLYIDEYTEGCWNYDPATDSYYYEYSPYYFDLTVTVEFDDGNSETMQVWEVEDNYGVCFNFYDYQYGSPWGVGSHTVDAEWDGSYSTFNVMIEQGPIASITISPISLIENTNGYTRDYYDGNGDYAGEYYYYYFNPEYITVVFNDSTPTFTGTIEDFNAEYGNDYWVYAFSNQDEDHQWSLGTNRAFADVGNYRVPFNVVITATPVSSVTVDTKLAVENDGVFGHTASEWNPVTEDYTNVYFWYWIDINSITVTFNDGTPTFTGTVDDFNDQFGYYLDYDDPQSYATPFVLGDNPVPFTLMGYEGTFNVTVIECPIQIVNGKIVTTMPGTHLKWTDLECNYNIGTEIDLSTQSGALYTGLRIDCCFDGTNELLCHEQMVVYGELTSDTDIDDNDIDEAFNYLVNDWNFDYEWAEAADVNHDGVFDAFDIALIDLIASGNREKEYALY